MVRLLALLATMLTSSATNAQTLNLETFRDSGGASVEDVQKLKGILGSISVEDALKKGLNIDTYLDPRIVGGHPARIEDSPWQVALIFGQYKEPFRAQFCGGSIINVDWVVTAAHCIVNDSVNRNPANVDVIANTTFYNSGGDRVGVKEVIVHEKYKPTNNDFDIALLHLGSHVAKLTPIVLPRSADPLPPDTKLIVTGWGAIREGSPGTAYLVSANIPVVANDVCNQPLSYNHTITDNMICAGLRDGGLDSCQGDSGGPAVAVSNNTNLLMGIVSLGEGCARKYKYGVYTNVRAFRSWLDAHT